MKKNVLLLLIFLLSSVAFHVSAQTEQEQERQQDESAPRTFSFSGDSTSISLAEGNSRTILSGNALIRSDSLRIRADEIELYGEDFRYARCSSGVEVEDAEKKLSLSTDSLFFDRERELLRIRSYSEMVDLKNELVIKCGYMEHYNEEEISIFQIGVRILKATDDDTMVCRSDYARYDRKADTLELSGSPEVYWRRDRYSALRIRINLETEEISLEGDVEGEFTSNNE